MPELLLFTTAWHCDTKEDRKTLQHEAKEITQFPLHQLPASADAHASSCVFS